MDILHVVRSDGFAGVERHVTTLAAGQALAGHRVRAVGGRMDLMTQALADSNVRHARGDNFRQVIGQLKGSARADILHLHMTAAELAGALPKLGPAGATVATRHFARPRGATTVGRAAAVLIRRRLDAQIAISQYVADRVDGEATVVYPGVPDAVTPSPSERAPMVLVVQRLQKEKETEVAVRAFAMAQLDGWELWIVGRGPEKQPLIGLAYELGIGQVTHFAGFRDDVPELMRQASVLLAPCRVEGLGLSVLEGMAAGLPTIACDAGAYPETVGLHPRARLFPPGDAAAAAEFLTALANDPEAQARYGHDLQAIQRRHFSIPAQVAATDEIYRGVLL